MVRMKAGNADTVARKKEYLVANKHAALEVGRAARQVTVEQFDAKTNAARFVAVLQGLYG